jgi:hypothetical protein
VKKTATKRVTANQARAYLGKAEEYLEAASDSLELHRYVAATSLAVHAGINAADAITGARLGQRAAGQDHTQAIDVLSGAGKDGVEAIVPLKRLLPLKTRAEYDPEVVPKAEAERAIRWAEKVVVIARRVIVTLD